MKTKTIFQKTAVIFAMFIFIVFAFNACSTDDDSESDSVALTLTEIGITKITVRYFPFKDPDGHNWDFLGGADAYAKITRGSTTVLSLWDRNVTVNGVEDIPIVWNINPSVKLQDIESEYGFHIKDMDGALAGDDDYIIGQIFSIPEYPEYFSIDKAPKTDNIVILKGTILNPSLWADIDITLTWE